MDNTADIGIVPIAEWADTNTAGTFPADSLYVETCWLPVIGPTATLLLRAFGRILADTPPAPPATAVKVSMPELAAAMGLVYRVGRSSPFTSALQRLVMFGLAHPCDAGYFVKTRNVPAVADRHLNRLPAGVQANHHRMIAATPAGMEPS